MPAVEIELLVVVL